MVVKLSQHRFIFLFFHFIQLVNEHMKAIHTWSELIKAMITQQDLEGREHLHYSYIL